MLNNNGVVSINPLKGESVIETVRRCIAEMFQNNQTVTQAATERPCLIKRETAAGISMYGFEDSEGQIIIPPRFYEAQEFSEGLAWLKDFEGRWYIIDTRGRKKFETRKYKITQPEPYKDGWSRVRVKDRNGEVNHIFLNVDGKKAKTI